MEPDQFQVSTVTDSFEGTIASKLGIAGRRIPSSDGIRLMPTIITWSITSRTISGIQCTRESFLDTKDKYAYFYGGNYGLIETKMPESAKQGEGF